MNLSVYLFYQRDVWRLFFSRNVFYFLFWLVQFVTSPLFPAAQLAMLSAHLWNISQVRNTGPIRSPPHFWSGTQSFFILVTFIRLESKVLWLRSQGGVSSLLISVYIRKSICYFKVTWTEYSSEPFLITCCPSSDCPSAVRMFVYFSHI